MRAGIALGSNLGDRHAAIEAAINAIRAFATPPVLRSSLHETAPVDCPPGSPPFVNATMEIGFDGNPLDLLDQLQALEHQAGRPDHRPKNSPRTIDLDVLYCDHLVLDHPRLILPHPLMTTRRFVLAPLAEIVPHLRLPGQPRTIAELLSTTP